MKLVVCIKQVPMVSELPWDPETGQLKRHLAEGMVNPACKHALEAALKLKQEHGGTITVISMGPPSAEEAVREALALGADRGVLLTDPKLAGADTLATSYALGRAIETVSPDFDLVLLGCHTTDSETGQVGPQLAENLDLPAAAYVERLEIKGGILSVERESDSFLERLDMGLPALVTITTRRYHPRAVPLAGVEEAFTGDDMAILDAEAIGAKPGRIGWTGSAGLTRRVYSATAEKRGVVIKGAPKRCVVELLDGFGDRLAGVIGKDLGTE